MKLHLPPMIALHAAAIVATAAVGAAVTLLYVGREGEGRAAATLYGQAVALDIDRLGAADAVSDPAPSWRGAVSKSCGWPARSMARRNGPRAG